MRRLISLVLAVALAITAVGLLIPDPNPPAAASAGLPLPHVTLDKAAERGYGPTAGCMHGQTRPYQSGMHLLARAFLTCGDGGGYKIVSLRLVVRLYARRVACGDCPWHVYSNRATVDSRQWQGEVEVHLDDYCNLGHGWNWYQARISEAISWSMPHVGTHGTTHRNYRVRSADSENCAGSE